MTKSIKINPDYKVVPWKYKAVQEILRWCWKVKKDNAALFYNGTWRTLPKIYNLKLPKTITLVRKRWNFSNVLRIQDGQEYLSIKLFVVPISSYILHHTPQPCDNYIPLSADDNSKMTLGVMHDQRFIINIVICQKTHTRDRNCLLRHF